MTNYIFLIFLQGRIMYRDHNINKFDINQVIFKYD